MPIITLLYSLLTVIPYFKNQGTEMRANAKDCLTVAVVLAGLGALKKNSSYYIASVYYNWDILNI